MFSEHLMPPIGVEPWLEYLCKLADCTFSVQPANLHKLFSDAKLVVPKSHIGQ